MSAIVLSHDIYEGMEVTLRLLVDLLVLHTGTVDVHLLVRAACQGFTTASRVTRRLSRVYPGANPGEHGTRTRK